MTCVFATTDPARAAFRRRRSGLFPVIPPRCYSLVSRRVWAANLSRAAAHRLTRPPHSALLSAAALDTILAPRPAENSGKSLVLSHVSVNECIISPNGARALADLLHRSSAHLGFLSALACDIMDASGATIARALHRAPALATLCLSANDLRVDAARVRARLRRRRRASLAALSFFAMQALGAVIRSCPSLCSLDLSHNPVRTRVAPRPAPAAPALKPVV